MKSSVSLKHKHNNLKTDKEIIQKKARGKSHEPYYNALFLKFSEETSTPWFIKHKNVT